MGLLYTYKALSWLWVFIQFCFQLVFFDGWEADGVMSPYDSDEAWCFCFADGFPT